MPNIRFVNYDEPCYGIDQEVMMNNNDEGLNHIVYEASYHSMTPYSAHVGSFLTREQVRDYALPVINSNEAGTLYPLRNMTLIPTPIYEKKEYYEQYITDCFIANEQYIKTAELIFYLNNGGNTEFFRTIHKVANSFNFKYTKEIIFMYWPEQGIDKEEDVLFTIAQNGLFLKYVVDYYRNREDIVRLAINQNASAYIYASTDLKNNRELTLEAIERDPINIKYASERLRDDKELVLRAVEMNYQTLSVVPKKWQSDQDVVNAAIKQSP